MTPVVNDNFVYCFHRTSSRCVMQTTDFVSVWSEHLDAADIVSRGRVLGYTDLRSESKRSQLLAVLKSNIYSDSAPPTFTRVCSENDDTIRVSVNSAEVRWEFTLRKMSESETAGFFVAMNLQQFGEAGYLRFQISQLQDLLTRKDHYIKFLAENFKQANGARFLQKYRKNNPSSAEAVNPFDLTEWRSKASALFQKKTETLQRQSSSISNLKWNLIRNAITDEWSFADVYNEEESDTTYQEPVLMSSLQPQSKSTSPKKRLRIGIVSTRKKRKTGSSQPQMSSQLLEILSSQLPVLVAEDETELIPSSPIKPNTEDIV